MARAKRTARADARRRYRAERGLPDELPDDEAVEPAASDVDRSKRPATGQTARVGIATAFRLAFRPLDVRGDLQALPRIALRSKALWVPLLLTLLSAVVFMALRPEGKSDIASTIAIFLFQYFLATPAIGGVFIAGFLAPRASWLLGVIVGFASAACYTFLGLGGFINVPPTVDRTDVVVAAFVMSPIVGAFFAASAAWYRRFLQLSNPNRGRAQQAAGRSNGRNRTGGSNQKAGVRR